MGGKRDRKEGTHAHSLAVILSVCGSTPFVCLDSWQDTIDAGDIMIIDGW